MNSQINRKVRWNISGNIDPCRGQRGQSQLARSFFEATLLEEKKQFFYSTDLNTSITYIFTNIGANISAFYKYTGKLPQYFINDSGDYIEGYIDNFHMMDLTFTKSFFKRKVQLAAGIKNLFNITSIYSSGASTGGVHGGSDSSLAGYGRSVFLQISYNFQKY